LDEIIKRLGEMAAELGSLDAMIAYYDSPQMTSTSSRAWAEGILEAFEQIKLYYT
jgi:hypothetical protein